MSAPKKPRQWAPHVWEGMDVAAWFRLLGRNRYAVRPSKWYVAAIVSGVAVGHSLLAWLQQARYGDAVARAPVAPPIFILGHWRSGTTLLHELLIRDPRHTFPTTYQCMEPHHFLLTQGFFHKRMNWMVPDKRPMDNMAAGWGRPQEDEFALCMLGQPSPYADLAFPEHPPQFPGSLDLSGLSPRELRRWKRTFLRFVRTLAVSDPRRLVLKSPPHTARVPALLELFPDAKFVHIVRDPYDVFPSTVNLWKSLQAKEALQRPTFAGVREKVFTEFRTVYDRLEQAKPLFRPGQFTELKYEDLVADPVARVREVYDQLGLGDFASAEAGVRDYAARNAGFEKNRYELPAADAAEVTARWGDVIGRYGYPRR